MLLSVLAVEGASKGQVAFLTPKRLGPATVRNRLRRRMREIFRRGPAAVPAGFHLVWMARAPVVDFTFAELKECMLGLMARAGR
jgi:ribonuclease P protein component